MIDHPQPLLAAVAFGLFYLFWRYLRCTPRALLLLPPGPRRLPIIGNLLDLPTRDIEVRFRDLSAQYGQPLDDPLSSHVC